MHVCEHAHTCSHAHTLPKHPPAPSVHHVCYEPHLLTSGFTTFHLNSDKPPPTTRREFTSCSTFMAHVHKADPFQGKVPYLLKYLCINI